MTAVDDVYDFLETQGLAGGGSGWTLLRRRIMDAPAEDQLVVITEDGGVRTEMGADGGIGDAAMLDPAVMVTVRARAWDGDASRAKANAIFTALHGLRAATLGATAYYRVRAQTPEPIFIGFDDRGRPMHTTSYRLLRAVAA